MIGGGKKLFFALGGLVLGGALFGYLVQTIGLGPTLASLKEFGLPAFAGFVGISLLNFSLYTWRWQIILKAVTRGRANVPFGRLFLHRMSGYAAGYVTPAAQVAGEPVRVAMLAADKVPVKEGTGSIVLDLAFEITAYVVYVLLGIVLALAQGIGAGGELLLPLLFALALLSILVLFFASTVRGGGFFGRFLRVTRLNHLPVFKGLERWLRETEKMMTDFFPGRKATVLGITSLSFVMVGFRALEVFYIAFFLGTLIAPRDAFLMSTLPGMALLLPIPGGLGVFEGSNAAMFALLGVAVNALAYTLIIRLRDFLFIALGFAHAVRMGERLFSAKSAK